MQQAEQALIPARKLEFGQSNKQLPTFDSCRGLVNNINSIFHNVKTTPHNRIPHNRIPQRTIIGAEPEGGAIKGLWSAPCQVDN